MAAKICPLTYAGEAFGGISKCLPEEIDNADAMPTQSKIEPTKIRAVVLIKPIKERMALSLERCVELHKYRSPSVEQRVPLMPITRPLRKHSPPRNARALIGSLGSQRR